MGFLLCRAPSPCLFPTNIRFFAFLTFSEVQRILNFLFGEIYIDIDLIYLFFGGVSMVFLTGRGSRDHGDDFGDWVNILGDFLRNFVTILAFTCRAVGHEYG